LNFRQTLNPKLKDRYEGLKVHIFCLHFVLND
jgi:hypothetical protein